MIIELLKQYWPHFTALATTIIGWIVRKKVLSGMVNIVKWFAEHAQPDHMQALETHEKRDDERFSDVKGYIGDVKAEMIMALQQNIGYIREDLKTERESTEKRMQFLEKVFLDSRLDRNQ